MMDNCLFCYKVIDHQSPPPSNSNPSLLICKTLSNLFSSLNSSAELFYVKNQTKLIDSRLCPACFKCIDQVQATFKKLEALQKNIEEFRQKIQNELIGGYKKSRAVSKGQLQSSESFQLRKSIVKNIAPSSVLEYNVLVGFDEPNDKDSEEYTTTAEDFNNFHDFDDDLPILSPNSTFDDLNLNLSDIKPTFGSLWNLKPLQIVLTRCDEENIKSNIVKLPYNAKSSNPLHKKKIQRKSTSKTLFSDFKCESCNIYFSRKPIYSSHMLNKHGVDTNLDIKTTDDLVSLDSETDDDLPDDEEHMSYKTFRNIIAVPNVAKCPICKKKFVSVARSERKRTMFRHLTTVHSIQINLKRDNSSSEIAKYGKYYKIEKVNGIDQVECPLCSKLFEGKALTYRITRHFDTIHKPNKGRRINRRTPRGEFTCRKCRAKFTKRPFLERHKCFSERLTLLKSSEAGQINENTTLLQLDGGIVDDKIQCDQCGKVFEGKGLKWRIQHHLLRIHNIDVRPKKNSIKKEEKGPWFCIYPGCASAKFKMEFVSLGHFKRHMKSHGEVLQLEHQCDRCTESYESYSLLRIHQLKTHEKKEEAQKDSFICDICAKVFDKRNSLTVHQTSMHQLKFACHVPNCNKVYTQQMNFDYHLRSYHGIGDKLKYQCQHENCNYSSNRRANFENHTAKHIEVRAVKCELCNVAVKTKRGLDKHMFTCHTHPESAKRQCSECEMSFLFKRELENHLIVRHGIGEKIKCTYCPREFSIRRYMRNHVKRDHPNEDNTKAELMKRWVPLEMLEAPLEVQKELITSITASEQGRKENEQKNP